MRNFASFHPLILFLYYVFIVFVTVFMMHPIILLLSLIGSISFFFMLAKPKQFCKDIGFYSIVFLFIVITNPIFVHKGETILFFYNDHPITMEAILYGVVIGMMLVSIIFWSKAYSLIMTSDKFVYLFGKIMPKLSLVLAMALKFIPLFKSQIKKVNATQKTLGLYTSESITDKIFSGIRTFNSILTWSLENAVLQADAMKARGYGLAGRTNFSIFTVKKRDIFLLCLMILLFCWTIYEYTLGSFEFYYYPKFDSISVSAYTLKQQGAIFLLTMFPFIFEVKEHIQWKFLQSKMSTSPIQIQTKKL